MAIPTPKHLPEKFSAWRDKQVDALIKLKGEPKRVTAICAPTGFGKTPVYVEDAIESGEPTCIVTDSRALQDQLMDDYESIGLVDIRGRNNYPCHLRSGMTCDQGYNARCPYKGTPACPSSYAEMKAGVSSLVVTNYDKWTAARKYGQGMQHFTRVVFDEGHKAVDAVARAMQVVLHAKEIEETLGLNFPPQTQEIVDWKPWAAEARAEAEEMLGPARQAIVDDPKPAWVRHFMHLRNLSKKLATISTCNPDNWVVEEIKDGYQFDPIRVGKYAEAVLLLGIPRIVLVSATIRPKTLFLLGIPAADFTFHEFSSDFDPTRCPIYYLPVMRADAKHTDWSLIWLKLDQLAAKRTDRKGIIHTISYARRDEIVARSRFAPHMLINERGEASTGIVDAFKEAADGTILVSPSVSEGFDFPGRQCEWQFVCKIPFPVPSRIVKARQEDDKEYGPYQAMNKLVQTFGRGMRSKEDRCENFIVDEHMDWFLPRYAHLAPRSFHGFYKRVSALPQPPERL